MSLTVPIGGESDALQYFTNSAGSDDLVLRLFTNDVEPSETDTAENYTEAKGYGYKAITLVGSKWNSPSNGHPSSTSYPEQTFIFSGPIGSIFGYYMTRARSGRIAIAERFASGPFKIVNNGDEIRITPSITAD